MNAPTQYRPRLAATAVYLQHAHCLALDRLSQALQDLFGAPLCAATLALMSRNTAECWQGFAERVRDLIPSAAPVKHLEETGFRIAGRTQWLHAICTPWLTF